MPPITYFPSNPLKRIHFDKLKFRINEFLDFESLGESTIEKYKIDTKELDEYWYSINDKGEIEQKKNFYKYRIRYYDKYDNKINIMTRQWDNLWNHCGSITTTGKDDFERIRGLETSLWDIFGIPMNYLRPIEIEIAFDYHYDESYEELELWFKKHIHSPLRKFWWRFNSKKKDGTYTDYIGTNRSNGAIKMYNRASKDDPNTFRLEVTFRKKRLADLKIKHPEEIFKVDWTDKVFELMRIVDVDWSRFAKKDRNRLQIVYSRCDLAALKDKVKAEKINRSNYYKPNKYRYELKKSLIEWNRTLQEYESPMVEDWAYLLDDF